MRRLAAATLAVLLLGAAPVAAAADDGRCPEPGTGRVVHCRHVVRRGEWLWSIARTNLRQDFGQRRPTARAVRRRAADLHALNRAVIGTDPDRLRPGTELRLYPWVGAPAGPLDPTFGRDGLATATIGRSYADARALDIAEDGRIVTAGQLSRSFGVFRFTADGRQDPTFGTGGHVATAIGTFARAAGVVVQSDGRIVAAGTVNPSAAEVTGDVALVRYLPDGRLDPGFGGDGIVTTSLGGYTGVTAVAIDRQARLVVTGGTTPAGSNDTDVVVLRYLPDGSLDPTFGTAGVVRTDVAGSTDVGEAVDVDAFGRIVVGGTGRGAGGQDALVLRYLPDGTPDPTFGVDGRVTTTHSPFDDAAAVVTLADGSIVTAGSTVLEGIRSRVVLTRFAPDGAVVRTTLTDAGPDGRAHGLAVDGPGRLAVAGRADGIAALARYTPADRLESVVRTPFGGDRSAAFAVAFDARGRVVVAGCTCDGAGSSGRGGFEIPSSVVVARYRAFAG